MVWYLSPTNDPGEWQHNGYVIIDSSDPRSLGPDTVVVDHDGQFWAFCARQPRLLINLVQMVGHTAYRSQSFSVVWMSSQHPGLMGVIERNTPNARSNVRYLRFDPSNPVQGLNGSPAELCFSFPSLRHLPDKEEDIENERWEPSDKSFITALEAWTIEQQPPNHPKWL